MIGNLSGHNAAALSRPEYSVNTTFICTGKPKSLCNLLYFDIHFIALVWNGTKISLRCACTSKVKQAKLETFSGPKR